MTFVSTSLRISHREWTAVVALVLLAFFLRTYDLQRVPYGLHNDEVIETKTAESVAAGRGGVFFPEDTGAEGLHYYYAAAFINVFGIHPYALRLPAVFQSLIVLCVIWALARRLFGPIVALTAAAAFAVAFWPLAFGRIISHTIMLVPTAALAAYFFWRAYSTPGRRAFGLWAVSGLWLGLALLAYTAARVLPLIFVVFGLYLMLTKRPEWQRWVKAIALVLAIAALVSAPLFIYLAQHPEQDDLDFFDIDRPLRELQQGNVKPALETSLRTLGMFAFYGDPLPYYDVPGRPVFEPIGSILLLIGVLLAIKRWRTPQYAFVLAWLGLSLVPGMLSQPAPNWTRTLGAQVVVFAVVGFAVEAWVRRFPNKLAIVALGLIFVGNLVWTAHDYFTYWPTIDTVRFWHQSGLRAVADQVQSDPATTPVALCVPDNLIDERIPWWKPAWQHLRYLLNRPAVSLRYFNCVDTLVFIDGPARYAFPDAADEAALQPFPIYRRFLAQASAAPSDRITLPDRLGIILALDSAPATLADQLQAIQLSPIVWDGSSDPARLPINFADKVEFLGYALSTAIARPNDTLELMTYWRVTDQLPPQVSQFTHVLNAAGEIVTQADRLMVTSQSLRAGDVVAQVHRLTLPEMTGTGKYPIAIGLYTQPDGKRLPVLENGQPRGDRVFLQSIEIK